MSSAKTDWDAYYRARPGAARFSRRITARHLVAFLRRCAQALDPGSGGLVVAELGGGNSCFADAARQAVRIEQYHIVDNNPTGLEQTRRAFRGDPAVHVWDTDLLDHRGLTLQADVVFSVGLIEHFDAAGTAHLIEAHFRILRAGGFAIVSYPTPTFLYRVTRRVAEALGVWIFHDERPLAAREVFPLLTRYGRILHSRIIWPILLTQQMVLARKQGDAWPGAEPPRPSSASESAGGP